MSKEIKLTDREVEVSKALKTLCYEWLGRDQNGDLYAYEKRPSKYTSLRWKDWWHSDSRIIGVQNGKDLFDFIKWDDEEPTNIDDLLKELENE